MQMTLEEQEQTQVEQDQVLEAKLEETKRLATGKTRCLNISKHTFSFSFFYWFAFLFNVV